MLQRIKTLVREDLGLFMMSVLTAVLIVAMFFAISIDATATHVTIHSKGRNVPIEIAKNMTLSGVQKIDTDTGCQVIVEFQKGDINECK